MENRVVLFGSSMGLDIIGAALSATPGLELLRAPLPSESAAAAVKRVLAFEPGAIIFDLVAGLPDSNLLRRLACPHITLLGFDLETHRLLVLSGEHTQLSTTADLVRSLARAGEEDECRKA
jgi:hypothetical protein